MFVEGQYTSPPTKKAGQKDHALFLVFQPAGVEVRGDDVAVQLPHGRHGMEAREEGHAPEPTRVSRPRARRRSLRGCTHSRQQRHVRRGVASQLRD